VQSLEHGTECPGASVMWLVERIFFAEAVHSRTLMLRMYPATP
jgi:hypothetical protein